MATMKTEFTIKLIMNVNDTDKRRNKVYTTLVREQAEYLASQAAMLSAHPVKVEITYENNAEGRVTIPAFKAGA